MGLAGTLVAANRRAVRGGVGWQVGLLRSRGGYLCGRFAVEWVIQSSGLGSPLFCITPGYGDGIALCGLAAKVGRDQPFVILQPARVDGVFTARDREPLLDSYLREIRAVQPTGPYRLCGYSTGGLAAFELARRLHCLGETVAPLLLLDAPFGLSSLRNRLGPETRSFFGKFMPAKLNVKSQWAHLLQAALLDGGFGRHLELFRDYVPGRYAGSVILVQSRWSPFNRLGGRRRWRSVVEGDFSIGVSGGNNSFLREHAEAVAGIIRNSLAKG